MGLAGLVQDVNFSPKGKEKPRRLLSRKVTILCAVRKDHCCYRTRGESVRKQLKIFLGVCRGKMPVLGLGGGMGVGVAMGLSLDTW